MSTTTKKKTKARAKKAPASKTPKRPVQKKVIIGERKNYPQNLVGKTTVQIRDMDFDPHHYFNRDLSWLDFNFRVLNESIDERTPLLERLKFCDIFRNNNDEFFMKRIGALLKKLNQADDRLSIDGRSPEELIKIIQEKVIEQQNVFFHNWSKNLIPELENEGIKLLTWKEITQAEKKSLQTYFKRNIYPILTPLAVDSGHPFPFLSNLSKSVAICMRKPEEKEKLFARLKIPSEIPQWIRLKPNNQFEYRLINIDEIILSQLESLFTGMIIEATTIFRVTRNAALDDEEGDDAEDKMEWVEEGLRERKFAPLVRLEVTPKTDPWILQFLLEKLELREEDVYEMTCVAHYTKLSKIYDVNRPFLKYKKFKPRKVKGFENNGDKEGNIFNLIKKKDILVHYPYESFSDSVLNFIEAASEDPMVQAIKIILYRTDSDGRLINTLIQAAENKKQVACIIELKARFDEENNIQWAQKLEEAGVHVSYGLMDLKTHAKLLMVVRQDHDGINTYVNIGTGNYNSQTSKLYTDFGFFTCKKTFSDEVMEVFNFLTGRSLKKNYKKLLVAPFNMFKKFKALINEEIKIAQNGGKGRIIAKMNQLEDPQVIEELYKASQGGVKVTLLIRGFCNLRPGVKGLSENIEVISLVGRLLEHSRVFYFGKGKKDPVEGDFYIGSADWMHRNLFDRVEVITPLGQRDVKQKIWDYLELFLTDNRHSWYLQEDGSYIQSLPAKKKDEINSQKLLLKNKGK